MTEIKPGDRVRMLDNEYWEDETVEQELRDPFKPGTVHVVDDVAGSEFAKYPILIMVEGGPYPLALWEVERVDA